VSAVSFLSTHLKTLSASPAGGLPAVFFGLVTATGTSFGRGRRLVLKTSIGNTGPTSVHNRYTIFRYFDTIKNDIYIKETKN
jgi:hypothetical protein